MYITIETNMSTSRRAALFTFPMLNDNVIDVIEEFCDNTKLISRYTRLPTDIAKIVTGFDLQEHNVQRESSGLFEPQFFYGFLNNSDKIVE